MQPFFTIRCIFLAGIVAVLAACSHSPMGHRQINLVSDSQLAAMGQESYAQMKQENTIEHDPAINGYVNCVASAITRNIPGDWEVTVFKDDQVNAFALPGGKIGVYTGLLDVATSPDQLAAVIGHEVGHVVSNHHNARISAQYASSAGMQILGIMISGKTDIPPEQTMALLGLGAQFGLLMPYTRSQEAEADIVGQNLMAQAGFDPEAAITLWENMQKHSSKAPPELLSTHPAEHKRIAGLRQNLYNAQLTYREAKRRPECPRP